MKQPELTLADAFSNKPGLETRKIQGKDTGQAARQGLRQKHQQVLNEGCRTEQDTKGSWKPYVSTAKGKTAMSLNGTDTILSVCMPVFVAYKLIVSTGRTSISHSYVAVVMEAGLLLSEVAASQEKANSIKIYSTCFPEE